jgi:hypothetical protein
MNPCSSFLFLLIFVYYLYVCIVASRFFLYNYYIPYIIFSFRLSPLILSYIRQPALMLILVILMMRMLMTRGRVGGRRVVGQGEGEGRRW